MQNLTKKATAAISLIAILLLIFGWNKLRYQQIDNEIEIEYPMLALDEEFFGIVSNTYQYHKFRYPSSLLHVTFQNGTKRTIKASGSALENSNSTLQNTCVYASHISKRANSDTLIVTYFDRRRMFILELNE